MATDLTRLLRAGPRTLSSLGRVRRNHCIFKELIASNHTVLTTNFDAQIESAYAGIYGSDAPLNVAYRDKHFREAASWSEGGLYKLHGSVHDATTIAATFEATRPGAHVARVNFLKRRVSAGDLVVIGYSGGDDTDVVPALVQAPAADRRVYWLDHEDISRVEGVDASGPFCVYGLGLADKIPDVVKGRKSFEILNRMVKSGGRQPDHLFLILGDSNAAFFSLVSPGEPLPQGRSGVAHRLSVLQPWFKQASPDDDALRLLVGTVLTYLLGSGNMPQRFSAGLTSLIAKKPEWRAVALPKMAMAAYDLGECDRAVELAQAAIKASNGSGPRTASTTVPREVAEEACLDAYNWLAEAHRYEGRTQECLEAVESGLRAASATPGTRVARRIHTARGNLLGVKAETLLMAGQLEQGRQLYRQAASEHSKGIERMWYWYCRLGKADALRAQGRFAMRTPAIKPLHTTLVRRAGRPGCRSN